MVRLPSMATSLLATIYNSLSLGNILLLLLLLFILHYLMVLYEFRNMPPGPRLTTLPVLGNIFSLDSRAEKLPDVFQRPVFKIDVLCDFLFNCPCLRSIY